MRITGGFEIVNATKEMRQVNEIMEESNGIRDALDKHSEVLFSPFTEVASNLKAMKDTVVKDTAKMRSPVILNTRITMELSQNKLSEKTWETATALERIEMMDKMFEIMMEEMQIPDQIRKDLHLLHSGTESKGANMIVTGHCNRFVSPNASGKFAITEKPVVEMHHGLMYQEFDTALGALYNQAIKVMQQATCLEPKGTYIDPVEQEKWAAEIKDQINGKFAEVSDMQQFAVNAEMDMLSRYRHIIKNKGIAAQAISFT